MQRRVLFEDLFDLARVDPVDVADAQRGHVAVALQILVEERHLAWGDTRRYGEMWGDTGRYGEIWAP